MNKFGNWKDLACQDETNSLVVRLTLIQQMLNIFQSQAQALENIINHQPAQMAAQNSQHNIVNDNLEVGTKVPVNIEGLLGKLEPRFRGPNTIDQVLKNGNYKVRNTLGTVLKTQYPLHKLKIVSTEDDTSTHADVEIITKHRSSPEDKNKFEYFVKWKDFDSSETTWVKEDEFDTL